MRAANTTDRSRVARLAGRAAPLLATVAITLFLGWAARAPYQSPGAEDAVLRLSWRLRLPAAEVCRQRTQAELDALPAHMRSPQVCESRIHAYELSVRIDSLAAENSTVLPGGARGDRPVYVLRELALVPGPHRVRVRFTRADTPSSATDTLPRALALDTVLDMRSGMVELITLDDNRLVARSAR